MSIKIHTYITFDKNISQINVIDKMFFPVEFKYVINYKVFNLEF